MIQILRLGHRIPRDERITTHCALVSRAFGVEELYYTGKKDSGFENSIKRVTDNFGGNLSINYIKNPETLVKTKSKQGFFIIHLTMYGENFEKKLKSIKTKKKILIIIGGEKVEPFYYENSDLNISIGNQPHSEVAALGILLYKISKLKNNFKNAKVKIAPSKKGKDIKKYQ